MDRQDKIVYSGLDVGKFLCAFLILFYHYFSEWASLPTILNEALSLYAVAVALFMAISGFLIYNKLESIEEKSERWACVKKQVLRILRVYLLWSIPYILFTIYNWNWEDITVEFVLGQIRGWVFNSTFYTIWFMPSLAIGLLFTFWITEKMPERVVHVFAAAMYIIGSLMLTYSFLGDRIPYFTDFAKFADMWLGGARGWLFFAFPLIMVGRAMVKKVTKINWMPMMFLSVVFTVGIIIEALILRKIAGHTGIDMTFMMIPATFCILGFLLCIKIPPGKYLKRMRKMSVLIFMSQRLFLTVFPSLFPDIFNKNANLNFILICGGTILLSMILNFASEYNNKLAWLC